MPRLDDDTLLVIIEPLKKEEILQASAPTSSERAAGARRALHATGGGHLTSRTSLRGIQPLLSGQGFGQWIGEIDAAAGDIAEKIARELHLNRLSISRDVKLTGYEAGNFIGKMTVNNGAAEVDGHCGPSEDKSRYWNAQAVYAQ